MWSKPFYFTPVAFQFQLKLAPYTHRHYKTVSPAVPSPSLPRTRKPFYLLPLWASSLEVIEQENRSRKNNHLDNNTEKCETSDNNNDGTSTEDEQHPSIFISNQGKTANFMLYWPSITTFTLVKGWNETITKQFKDAVNNVVNKNPILTGRASKTGSFNNVKIMITSGAFPTKTHDYVNEIGLVLDGADTDAKNEPLSSSGFVRGIPNLDDMNETQILSFMDDFIAPIVPKVDSVIQSITNASPLFSIDLIHLSDGYACYVVKMSHCVGDGNCYFKIMEQINHEFNNHVKKDKDCIEWTNKEIATHEIFPTRFSSKDAEIMYGFPFILGLLRNFYHIRKQKKGYLLLSKKKILEKKKEFVSIFHGNVSTNDIITTALCEANLSTDIFAFTMNMRSLHCNYGGNFHNEVPFAKKAVLSYNNSTSQSHANPRAFREMLKRGFYYNTDEVPACPFVLGTVGRISSLATIQKLILNKDMKLICHSMLSSFVSNVPMDTAFISLMDDDCFVVLHNFRDINVKSGLLREISI
jgi:hypothetical protein